MGNQWWENEHTSTHMFVGCFFLLVPHFCAFVQSFVRRFDSIRFFNVTQSDKRFVFVSICVCIRMCAWTLIRVNANFGAHIYLLYIYVICNLICIHSVYEEAWTLHFINVRVRAWAFLFVITFFLLRLICCSLLNARM